MKSYSKEEIRKIVYDVSEEVFTKNKNEVISEISKAINGKNNFEAIAEAITYIYIATQKNCADTILETLNKILND